MPRLLVWLIAAILVVLPAPGYAQSAAPGTDSGGTILGLSYETAALATAAVVAGAVALNTFVAPNAGTVVAVLYVAHWVVQGAVVYAAGSWLGWWDDEVPVQAALLKD